MNMAVKPARRIALSLSHDHSHGPLGYLEMGRPAGPPVVFLHGFGADLLTWSLCLGPLARDYRLIAQRHSPSGSARFRATRSTTGTVTANRRNCAS